jgi:adenylosuccinate lyase
MKLTPLTALSPLDGRYQTKLAELRPLMSEYGLIYFRVLVEVRWLIWLADTPEITELTIDKTTSDLLENIITNFNEEDAESIKNIEKTTNHDVKAVEYFLQERLKDHPELIPFIHFACTSEDINNVSYALMLADARDQQILPTMKKILVDLTSKTKAYADLPMLSRTHGQTASPTTLGKEFANVTARLNRQYNQLKQSPILAKFNGAVGNYNAHSCAYPSVDWPTLNKHFIKSLNLEWNAYTTQIEPHDYLAEILHTLMRANTILIDLARDTWSYISIGYFSQKSVKSEVGSSTMPHKVNPIDFENAEGNLGLANALADHLANKLPISRWQRDLTDSTVLRNLGVVIGYCLLSYQALLKGLSKINANTGKIQADLEQHWEVLTEAVQTVMRRHGISDAYEQLKAFSRGKAMTEKTLELFIDQLSLTESLKSELKELTPSSYIGHAVSLANKIGDNN